VPNHEEPVTPSNEIHEFSNLGKYHIQDKRSHSNINSTLGYPIARQCQLAPGVSHIITSLQPQRIDKKILELSARSVLALNVCD
jgi:hypothetical protein